MFYSNNDNYMQDLYFYNQQPNTYNPYINSMGSTIPTSNMMPNQIPNINQPMNGMYMGTNNPMMMQNQHPNNLYPSIYRIINPVVSRVVANSNMQFLNEEALNNMTDTVFNIVEGQIDWNEERDSRAAQNENNSVTSNNTSSNTNNSSINSSRTTDSRQTITSQTTSSRNNRNDSLFRDLIKILILKEIFSRNQNRQFSNNPYFIPQNFNMNM